jgi:hypothetical protein
MPRPNDKERKRIEARKAANRKVVEAAAKREQELHQQVQAICTDALQHVKNRNGLPDTQALIERLDATYQLAMVCKQPSAAVAAILAEAKILGLLVDRSAVLHANANTHDHSMIDLTGSIDEVRERLLGELSERVGSRKAKLIAPILASRAAGDDEAA